MLRVGMLRVLQDVAGRTRFDDTASIHHDEVLSTLGSKSEIVRDQHDRDTQCVGELVEVVQDLALHGHIERRGGLVRDQQLGPRRETHRDQRALPHAAGKLVWVLPHPPLGVRNRPLRAARRHAAASALGDTVGSQGFLDLEPDLPQRIEFVIGSCGTNPISFPRRAMILLGDRGSCPRRRTGSRPRHLAGARQQPDDGMCRGRFPGPDSPTIAIVCPG